MKYVLCDGTPMLRLPDGTGLSREDCCIGRSCCARRRQP